MADLLGDAPIPLQAQIQEVHRELAMRRAVYPRRVEAGKMKQQTADQQIAAMEAVLKTLTDLKIEKHGDPGF